MFEIHIEFIISHFNSFNYFRNVVATFDVVAVVVLIVISKNAATLLLLSLL